MQNSMGKSNFADLYINTANSLKTRPQIKVSCSCDTYSPSSYYAGIIVYTANGEHTWRAGRRRGRSFYVLIIRTDDWSTALRDGTAGGVNSVHYYVAKQYFGDKFHAKSICCGGFTVQKGDVRFNSMSLNTSDGAAGDLCWRSDYCGRL